MVRAEGFDRVWWKLRRLQETLHLEDNNNHPGPLGVEPPRSLVPLSVTPHARTEGHAKEVDPKWVSGNPWERPPRNRGRRKVVRGEDQPSHSHNEYGGRGLGLGQHEPGLPASRVHPPLCGSISVGFGG